MNRHPTVIRNCIKSFDCADDHRKAYIKATPIFDWRNPCGFTITQSRSLLRNEQIFASQYPAVGKGPNCLSKSSGTGHRFGGYLYLLNTTICTCNYHTTEASKMKKVFPNSSWSYLSDISGILWQWTGVTNSWIQKTVPSIGLGSGIGVHPWKLDCYLYVKLGG